MRTNCDGCGKEKRIARFHPGQSSQGSFSVAMCAACESLRIINRAALATASLRQRTYSGNQLRQDREVARQRRERV